MEQPGWSRRQFLGTTASISAGMAMTGAALKGARAAGGSQERVVAVSSANGLHAVEKAVELAHRGRDTLDAAIAGVNLVEDDPEDISVGLGGLPNEQGIVELDAAVMHGPTHRAGSVAALQNFRNPSKVAKKVLYETDHVLLVGEGARRFALAQGFQEENLLTERSRKIWLYWKQSLSTHDDWLPPPPEEVDPDIHAFVERLTGTIHLSVRNGRGDLSCVTTTSGLFFKLPGRVGDSPIIGAGLYVDNEVGSCGSTGRGEANLQNLASYQGVEFMRQGLSPEEAGMEVLRRVASHTHEERLLNSQGQPNYNLKFYLLNKKGEYAGVSMWGPARYSVADSEDGARLEECAYLFER